MRSFTSYISDLFWDSEKQVGLERHLPLLAVPINIPPLSSRSNPKPSEVIPKFLSAQMCIFFATTLYYAATINDFDLFILKSFGIYFMLAGYNFMDCFWFSELSSGERKGQVTVTAELDGQRWITQLCIIRCKAKRRFVPTLRSQLVRGNTSAVHQPKNWTTSDKQCQKASFP